MYNIGLDIFNKYKDRPILVYFDPDVDGLVSGLFISRALAKIGVQTSYYINKNREHGFKLNASSLRGYLVIAVDFEVSREEMINLVSNGVSIIVLDHHEVEENLIHIKSATDEAVMINNQYPFAPDEDRYLSGAGVVFEAIIRFMPEFDIIEHRCLVGVTLLSDIREIENPKAKAYLKSCFNYVPSGDDYLSYLIRSVSNKSYGFGVPRLDRNFIDFTLSPFINSMLRFGDEMKAIEFILGKPVKLHDYREEQRNIIETMRERALIIELTNLNIVVIDMNKFRDMYNINITNFIGLLASKIKGVGKTTIAFVIDNGKVLRCSVRGRYDELNYFQLFKSLGFNTAGHRGAFGIKNLVYTKETWGVLNECIKRLDNEHKSTINIIDSNNLSMTLLVKARKIAENNCYCRDLYRTYIRYTGSNVKLLRSNSNKRYYEYCIDSYIIKSFREDITPANGLILPIMEKGYIQYYLTEKLS